MIRSLRKETSSTGFLLALTVLVGLPQAILAEGMMTHPFEVDARAAVLMDANSGTLIYGQKPKERIEPASLVKILTLFLVFDAVRDGLLRMEDKILISKKAWRTRGSKMFIRRGSHVELVELIKGIAVVSGNDACVAVAEFLQGSERAFVERMNEKLENLGIVDTQIRTVNGLPALGQYTTACDMALLARAYIQAHPDALQYHKLKEFTSDGVRQRNRNGLLWIDASVDGLKTGYTKEAGYHLLATAKREGQRFIAVVMDAKNPKIREREALRMLNFGFRNYLSVPLFEKGQVLLQLRVWKGKTGQVGLVAAERGVVTISFSQKTDVSWHTEAPKWLFAPVKEGEPIGQAIITSKKRMLKTIPLIADRGVVQGGLLKKTAHAIVLVGITHKIGLISILLLVTVSSGLAYCTRRRRLNRRKRRPYLPA